MLFFLGVLGKRRAAKEGRSEKEKEAGHYSGLLKNNLNFLALSQRTVCTRFTAFVPHNKIRLPYPPSLACHQMWLQREIGLAYLTNADCLKT
jgi:hypothetical protein